jgi:hypothetical protein
MKNLIDGSEILNSQICDVCTEAKHKQKFVHTKVQQVTKPYELVHPDTSGPFGTPTQAGQIHYILFIDNNIHWTTVYLFPDKKQETCIVAYQHFQAKVDAQGYKIKRFRCDNGQGEFDNKRFHMLLASRGTGFEFSPPHAHHKIAVAEEMVRTITKMARAMVLNSQAPHEFWGEAVNRAIYLYQQMPNEGLTKKND